MQDRNLAEVEVSYQNKQISGAAFLNEFYFPELLRVAIAPVVPPVSENSKLQAC